MGWFSEMRGKLGFLVGGQKLQEAIDQAIGLAGGIDRDEHEFRNISDRISQIRDLSNLRRERVLKVGYWLYLAYPLARRGLEITKDFVVGEGITFKAKNEKVQEVLDNFWNDPVNAWNLKQHTRVLELGLYGEQFYPVAVNKENGKVQMGYLDPLEISKVVTNKDNVEIIEKVIRKGSAVPGAPDINPEPIEVVKVDNDPNSPTFGRLMGDIFFFAVNKVSNATRGVSDLLPVIDWLEMHESFLMGIHEAAMFKIAHIWDVKVIGASDKELDAFRIKFGRIKQGQTRFHNENVEITSVGPNLDTAELKEHAGMIKRHIAAALGLPELWLSDPGDANKASASEMGVPTTKRLRARQKYFTWMISNMFDFVIDQAIIHGTLDENVDRHFVVMAPQIWAVDMQRMTNSLLTATQSIMLAEQNGWIDVDEARDTWKFFADQLGVTFARSLEKPSGSDQVKRGMDKEEKIFDEKHKQMLIDQGGKYAAAVQGNRAGPVPRARA